MRRFHLLLSAFALTLVFLVQAVPASAQATRTWVSGVGDDANPCSRTAPCKTFAGAISKTATNGEIDCLDPAGYGVVTITKSITIDCHQTLGSVLNTGTNGINIAFDSFAGTDIRKDVRLRGLSVQGSDSGIIGIRIFGSTNTASSVVVIDQCLVDGMYGGAARGISDERGNGGELYISDTTVRNIGTIGVFINPLAGAGAGARIDASIDNVRVQNANYGLAASSNTRVMVSRSIFSGSTAGGIYAESPLAASQVNVDTSVTSNNGTGVQNGGNSNTTVVISNSEIAFNGSGITGVVQSFGNNRISGNGSAGAAPTVIGSASPAFGQQ
jgi:hypothetical protein